jgi:hypothetical protein
MGLAHNLVEVDIGAKFEENLSISEYRADMTFCHI